MPPKERAKAVEGADPQERALRKGVALPHLPVDACDALQFPRCALVGPEQCHHRRRLGAEDRINCRRERPTGAEGDGETAPGNTLRRMGIVGSVASTGVSPTASPSGQKCHNLI